MEEIGGPQLQLPHQGWIRSQPFVQVDWGPCPTSNLYSLWQILTENLHTVHANLRKLLICVNMISGVFQRFTACTSSLISSLLLQGWVQMRILVKYDFSSNSLVWNMSPKHSQITESSKQWSMSCIKCIEWPRSKALMDKNLCKVQSTSVLSCLQQIRRCVLCLVCSVNKVHTPFWTTAEQPA